MEKKKKKIFSLLFSLIMLLFGAALAASKHIGLFSKFLTPYLDYLCLTNSSYCVYIPAALFIFLGVFGLAVRRRKPFSLLLVFYMIFMYYSLLVAFHTFNGINVPAFIISKVNQRPSLIILCLVLEVILFMILIVITSALNARYQKKHPKKDKKKEVVKKETNQEENTKNIEENTYDPSSPISFPKAPTLPKFSTFSSDDAPNNEIVDEIKSEATVDHIYDSPTASITAFQSAKERVEEKCKEDEVESFTIKRPTSLLGTTLERINKDEVESQIVNQRPIIGFEDKKEETKISNDPSIAPSNLPPTHPRYRMFEALKKKDNATATAPVTPKNEEKVDEVVMKESFAPSNLPPTHPRYQMFQALHESRDTSSTPSRPFVSTTQVKQESGASKTEIAASLSDAIRMRKKAEDIKALEAEKEERERNEQLKREAEEEAERLKAKLIEEDRARRESLLREQYRKEAEAKVRAELEAQGISLKKDDVHELPRTDSYYQSASTAKMVGGAQLEDAKEVKSEENSSQIEFKVGIGGLASNNAGEDAILNRQKRGYNPPTSDLLKTYPQASYEVDDATRALGELMCTVMHDFRVDVTLINIIKGPTVTMFEYDLAPGIMVSKVTSLQNNISMRIGGKQIRILAPVPGKSAIGIEVPNEKRATVGFKELLDPLKESGYKVPMILGRNILGEPMMLDVAKTPHLLIAGTTGSGKSVCINGLIVSILYTKSPKEVRLIMVDPKVVELQVYNRIPHLLTPVITEPKRVLKMLSWLVDEMERRYRVFSQIGTRNIEGFNQSVHTLGYATEKMPYIVLIMDEFADLMTVIGKDMESYVARLMAKARAAGIHVVMATQRPSSEVITGTIKNNIPSRISFAVSSAMNSRIILDESGAENLLGRGDMLYLANGSNALSRIQGAFLSDDEVDKVVSYVKSQGEPDYLDESIFEDDVEEDSYDDGSDSCGNGDEDMYEKAKQIVFERKGASASYLQRRLGIGYNRAAKLVEQMEEEGIVGPANGSKPREILRYE